MAEVLELSEEKENPGAPKTKGTITLVWFVLPALHLC